MQNDVIPQSHTVDYFPILYFVGRQIPPLIQVFHVTRVSVDTSGWKVSSGSRLRMGMLLATLQMIADMDDMRTLVVMWTPGSTLP